MDTGCSALSRSGLHCQLRRKPLKHPSLDHGSHIARTFGKRPVRTFHNRHLAVFETVHPTTHGVCVGKCASRRADYEHRHGDRFRCRRRPPHFHQIVQINGTVDVLQISSCRGVLLDKFLKLFATGGDLFSPPRGPGALASMARRS